MDTARAAADEKKCVGSMAAAAAAIAWDSPAAAQAKLPVTPAAGATAGSASAKAADAATVRGKAAANAAAAVARAGAGGVKCDTMCLAAASPLAALLCMNAQKSLLAVCLREPTTPLPTSAQFSVISLSGQPLSEAARASVSVRVVLPRPLLKEAFAALAAANGGITTQLVGSSEKSELAVRITLGDYRPLIASMTTLLQICSVLALIVAIESS